MDTGIPIQKQHLPLPVACVLLHVWVVRKRPDSRDSAKLSATLNDIAHALAMVAPIYTRNGNSDLPVEIPEPVLITATFTRGAQVLVAADGSRYGNLTARRADIESAAKILGATGLQKRHERGGGWAT